MALNWRLWRNAAAAPTGTIARGVDLTVTGDVGGDLVVGDNNFLLHIHEAPAEKPVRVRVVDARPAAAVDLRDRPDIMDRLVALSGGDDPFACVLAGGRGVGKTQVAAQYSRRRDDEGWEVVAWLPAQTEGALIGAWAQVAAQVKPSGEPVDPATAARDAIAWLDAHPVRALIVYDNATDPDVVNAWRPTGAHVEVLVTTNDRRFRGMGTLVDVGVFTSDQAVGYLASRSGLDDAGEAALLAEELGCLPLALAQAGALIGPDRRYRGYAAYRARLASVEVAKLLPRTPGDPYPQGLAEATLVAIDDLDEARRELLEVLALLSPDGVDSALLADYAPEDPDSVEDNLQDLVDRSLANRSSDGQYVLVHRMIRRVVQEAAVDTETFVVAVAAATLMLYRGISYDALEQWPMRDRFWNLGMQVMAVNESIVAMLGNDPEWLDREIVKALTSLKAWLAWHLRQVDNLDGAINLGEHVVSEQAALYDAGDPELGPARRTLADAYRATGRHDEAIALYEELIDDLRVAFGPDDQRTLTTRRDLGHTYRAAGRLDEAFALLAELAVDQTRVFGIDDPETLDTRATLGGTLVGLGRLDEAANLLRPTLDAYLRVRGPDDTGTVNARHQLALAYYEAGQLGPAIDMYAENLAALERVRGDDHPDTISLRSTLAAACCEYGAPDVAIPLLDANVNHLMSHSIDDPRTMLAGNELALAYQAAGHLDFAITLLEQVLEHAREVLADDDPTTVTIRENLEVATLERAATAESE